MLSHLWVLFIFASAISNISVMAIVVPDEADKTEADTLYQSPVFFNHYPNNLNQFLPDDFTLDKRSIRLFASRNPYSWMTVKTPLKRSQNSNEWLVLAKDSASKRIYNPAFEKKSRNPYSWMSDSKRPRNPYAWVNYV